MFVETLTQSTSVSRNRKVLLLPKPEYIAWHCFSHKLREEQAKAKWAEGRHSADVHSEFEDGRWVVAVRMTTEIVGSETVTKATTMATEEKPMEHAAARGMLKHGSANMSFSLRKLAQIRRRAPCWRCSRRFGQCGQST